MESIVVWYHKRGRTNQAIMTRVSVPNKSTKKKIKERLRKKHPNWIIEEIIKHEDLWYW